MTTPALLTFFFTTIALLTLTYLWTRERNRRRRAEKQVETLMSHTYIMGVDPIGDDAKPSMFAKFPEQGAEYYKAFLPDENSEFEQQVREASKYFSDKPDWMTKLKKPIDWSIIRDNFAAEMCYIDSPTTINRDVKPNDMVEWFEEQVKKQLK